MRSWDHAGRVSSPAKGTLCLPDSHQEHTEPWSQLTPLHASAYDPQNATQSGREKTTKNTYPAATSHFQDLRICQAILPEYAKTLEPNI